MNKINVKTYTVLFLLIFLSSKGSGQYAFYFGPEIGFSISRLPHSESNTYPSGFSTLNIASTENPLLSPVVGLSGQIVTWKHAQITLGLIYQMTGTRNSGHSESTSPTETYNTRWTENQTFHRFSLPLTAGYVFWIKKAGYSIFAGFRPNMIISGKYYYDWKKESNLAPYNETLLIKYNPVDPDEAIIPAKMATGQLLFGLSGSFNEHVKITLSANLGARNYFNQNSPDPDPVPYRQYEFMENDDFGITLTYLFNPKAKQEENEINERKYGRPVIAGVPYFIQR